MSLSILLINSFYKPFTIGGAEVVTEMLATNLAVKGHRVSVVTSCSRETGYSRERIDGVDVHRFFPENLWWLRERFVATDQRSTVDKLRWRLKDAWNRDAGKKLAGILDEIRPDVVHTHNIKGFSPIVWPVVHERGIPTVHTAHSYELICADGGLLKRNGEVCAAASRCMPCRLHGAWYQSRATAIDVFCSPSRYLIGAHAEAGIAFARTVHVRNGVAGVRTPVSPRRETGRPVRFLYLGQLAAHKGIETLLQAITLMEDHPFTIDIAGRGPLERKVEELAATDSRVVFHGFVEGCRKEQLLENADVLLFPSIWVENSPMSIVEAFCYGLPVIGSRVGALPELIDDGVNGLLFESGNASALGGSMVRLSKNSDELQKLKQGASRTGANWPTPEEMTSEYLEIYRSALQRRA